MTPTEAYAFYGDSIECTYYNGSGYSTVSLVPSTARRVYYRASVQFYGEDIPSWMGYDTSLQYVYYYATVSNYSNNPAYLGVDIRPNVHFANCTDFRFAALAYCGNNNIPNTSAGYSDSFIYINNLRFSNASNVSQSGYYPAIPLTRDGSSGSWYNLAVWADYHSDVIDTANLVRVGFNGARLDGGEIGIYLSLPQYNSSAVPGTGTIPDSGAVTTAPLPPYNVNVTVDVDLSPLQTDIQNVASDVVGIGNDVSGILGILGYEETETLAVLDLDPLDTLPTLDYVGALETADAILDDIPEVLSGSAVIFTMLNSIVATNSIWLVLIPVCMMLCLASWVIWRR